jgi:hypothetical protein
MNNVTVMTIAGGVHNKEQNIVKVSRELEDSH